jgi:hypothetical protein
MATGTDWRSELRRTWAMHDPTETGPAVRTFILGTTHQGAPFRLYVDAEGARHLLISGPGASTASPVQGESLRWTPIRLTFDGREGTFLDVSCPRAELFDVFDELLESVLEVATVDDDPITHALALLGNWRQLLQNRAARTLSHERELGLFAELWVLDQMFATGELDVDGWRGPLREPKDIVCAGVWVEVKGMGTTAQTFTVNGLEQLSDATGREGYVAVAVVEEGLAGQEIGDLVLRLGERTTQWALLEERLLLAGWDGATPTARKWSVTELYLVEAESCPRLTSPPPPWTVPLGVRAIRYDVDLRLARAASVRDPRTALRHLLRGPQ